MHPMVYAKKLTVFALLLCGSALTPSRPVMAFQTSPITYINSLAWSPDGTKIAVGGGSEFCDYENASDHAIKILNSTNLQVIQDLIFHYCSVTTLDWSSDGTQLVSTGGTDGTALVWNITTGKPVSISQNTSMLGRYMDTWSPDNTRIASVAQGSGLIIWNPKNGQELNTFMGGGYAIAWSPDGNKLVTGGGDGNIVIWNFITGQEIMNLEGHYGAASTVVWSSNGRTIVSGGWDETIRIWDAESGSLRRVLQGHTGIVAQVALSSDGEKLASASYDGTVKIWDVNTGVAYQTYTSAGPIYAVAWSPDGTQLVYGGVTTIGQSQEIQIVAVPESPTPTPTSTPPSTPIPRFGCMSERHRARTSNSNKLALQSGVITSYFRPITLIRYIGAMSALIGEGA